MKIKEAFLHYLWRTKNFDLDELRTTEDTPVQVLDFGEHNPNAGPDFLNAKVKIGETIWAGNIEIHVLSNEWLKHRHDKDSAYDNVILHVVYEQNDAIRDKNGAVIPCIELRKRIPNQIHTQYLRLANNEFWIPCKYHFPKVSSITKSTWLDRLAVEKLERKVQGIQKELVINSGNWEETFYHHVARSFGLKINVEPFKMLAQFLPLLTLAKYKNDLFQLEAIIFGQAGFLEDEFTEEYPNRLKKEFSFLQEKHGLTFLIPKSMWRFMRLRPANFPTVRLAQFAALVHKSSSLFSKILEAKTIEEITGHFDVEVSEYWKNHYVLGKPSKFKDKKIGRTMLSILMINTIVPFLFLYGRERQKPEYEERALGFLEQLAPEKNSIITEWGKLGVRPKSAHETQALIYLKNEYCLNKSCLECAIGNAILTSYMPTKDSV